uniref:Uncharacterized protein n=2 Tax=Aegilops tauschii subsp. strangulata TaxID=200361 RepID=A0A453Q6E5_AEGTS
GYSLSPHSSTLGGLVSSFVKLLIFQPGNESHKFYSDEHYLPTLFNMVDPTGVANWSVTRVDCSEGK